MSRKDRPLPTKPCVSRSFGALYTLKNVVGPGQRMTLREWQNRIKNPADFIVQASAEDGVDTWRPWPIGMSWQFALNAEKGDVLQRGPHSRLAFCALSWKTDQKRRPTGVNRKSILATLAANGIPNVKIPHEKYFETLPKYKFIVSPEGAGIDCHRHYEAFMAGCVPIMERNPRTEKKYRGCPILWTTDYSEITPEYLERKYKEMLDTKYNFDRLFLSHYDARTQAKIRAAGNFWMDWIDATQCVWYR